jgi:hypothetical protein
MQNVPLKAALQKIAESPQVPEVPPPASVQYTPPSSVVVPRKNTPVTLPPVAVLESTLPPAKDIHRPFAEVFSKIDPKEAPLRTPQGVAQIHEKRHADGEPTHVHGERFPSPPRPVTQTPVGSRTGAAPLSMLKANPKKDKGPSAENLSSLRAVLEASLAGKASKGEGEHTPGKKQEPVSGRVTPPPAPPRKQAPLIEESESVPSPKEVPEDVLRGLFADE